MRIRIRLADTVWWGGRGGREEDEEERERNGFSTFFSTVAWFPTFQCQKNDTTQDNNAQHITQHSTPHHHATHTHHRNKKHTHTAHHALVVFEQARFNGESNYDSLKGIQMLRHPIGDARDSY